jgi:hypothetical protein
MEQAGLDPRRKQVIHDSTDVVHSKLIDLLSVQFTKIHFFENKYGRKLIQNVLIC